MLSPIYLAVKARLQAANTGVNAIQWFNMQYDATITQTTAILIEFPEKIPFPRADNKQKSGQIIVRIHVVRQFISDADGSVPDSIVAEHDQLAEAVRTALERFHPADNCTGTLQFAGWQPWQKQKGMMLSLLDFETTKVL